LHPYLELRDLDKSVCDLKPLELADDFGGLHVFVEVDDWESLLIAIKSKLPCSLISMVDESEVGQVCTYEWQARGNMILQPLPEDSVVSRNIDDTLEVF